MADPGTMALMVGLQVAGKVMGAKSQYDAGRAGAATADANGQIALADGSAEEAAIRGRERAVQGDALVASGAGGTTIGTGSALETLRQNSINANLDILGARAGAAKRANAYFAEAQAKRKAATGALIGGLMGAGATALSGAGDYEEATGNRIIGGSHFPIPARQRPIHQGGY